MRSDGYVNCQDKTKNDEKEQSILFPKVHEDETEPRRALAREEGEEQQKGTSALAVQSLQKSVQFS